MLQFVAGKQSIIIKSSTTNKEYFVCECDPSHYSKRYLDVITSELTEFSQYMTNERLNYEFMEILNTCKEKKSVKELCDFICNQLDDVITKFIDEKGYKEQEAAKTILFVEQWEIDSILKYSVRAKLALLIFAQYPELEMDALKMISSCIKKSTSDKLFRLILNRVGTIKFDQVSWNFLKHVLFDSVDTYTIHFYAFIQKQVLATLQISKNPIVYILSVASDCMKWMNHVDTKPYTDFDRNQPLFKRNKQYLYFDNFDNSIETRITELIQSQCHNNISYFTIPTVHPWTEIAKVLLGAKRLTLTSAILLAYNVAQQIDKSEPELSARMPTLMTFSRYIPVERLHGTRVSEKTILNCPRLIYNNTSLKTFVYMQFRKYSNYKYITISKRESDVRTKILKVESVVPDLLELYTFLVFENGYERLYDIAYKHIQIR